VHRALLRPAVRRAPTALPAHGAGRREAVAQEGAQGPRRRGAYRDRGLERGARAPLRAHSVLGAARPLARRPRRLDRRVPERARARVRGRVARGDERGRATERLVSSRAPLKLGTRGSDLARTQSTTVADALRAAGHDVELTIIKTAGDRDQTSQFG